MAVYIICSSVMMCYTALQGQNSCIAVCSSIFSLPPPPVVIFILRSERECKFTMKSSATTVKKRDDVFYSVMLECNLAQEHRNYLYEMLVDVERFVTNSSEQHGIYLLTLMSPPLRILKIVLHERIPLSLVLYLSTRG